MMGQTVKQDKSPARSGVNDCKMFSNNLGEMEQAVNQINIQTDKNYYCLSTLT